MRTLRCALVLIALGVLASAIAPAAVAQESAAESARTWLGQAEEIEAFLKTAEVIELEDIPTGVTKPRKAILGLGGPAEAFAWKDIKPGIYRGYWESYKAEIAAYELDKLLHMGMTPPNVERRVNNELGAASMWVAPAKTFKELDGPPTPPSLHIGRWNWQLICAKMFHNLIYNKDPNLGNWMVDPAWNLIIIDNSRAFTTDTDERVHKLTRVDRDLWDRMAALDEPTLQAALGEWLDDGEIRAILDRRDEMRKDIDELVEKTSEAAVFVRYRVPPPVAPAPAPLAPAEPAHVDLNALAGQLVDALNETPVVLRGSELSWLGMVVRLEDYSGPDGVVARAGLDAGHTYGLITDVAGLICLTPDRTDPEPHEAVADLAGTEAEIFGITQDVDGIVVVGVTLSRAL